MRTIAFISATLLLIALATALLAPVTYLGPDFYFSYRATAETWLHGVPLYALDYGPDAIQNPPWLLPFLLPFGLLSPQVGQALWTILTLLALFAAIHVHTRPQIAPLAIALAAANLYVVDLLLRGQLDSLVLLGIVLGYWAIRQEVPLLLGLALLILSIKPPNVALTGLLFLLAIRYWPRRDWLRVALLPACVLLVSLGLDPGWPQRWAIYVQTYPLKDYLSSDLWHALDLLGLPALPFVLLAIYMGFAFLRRAWVDGLTERTLALALAMNLLFTTYANGNHYVLLIPVLLSLYRRSWRYALLCYGVSWVGLLRGLWGYDAAGLDLIYVALLCWGAWRLQRADAGKAHVVIGVAREITPRVRQLG